MQNVKIWYLSHQYNSHRRVATVYKELLKSRNLLVDSIEQADIVILHVEPYDYEAIYKKYPILSSKYVISYCVWEASILPERYSRSLELVQEVWTSSRYSLNSIKPSHSNVHVVPHAIERDLSYNSVDEEVIRRAIAYEKSLVYLLHIGRTFDKRKNIEQLVNVFGLTVKDLPRVRLVIKSCSACPQIFTSDPRVIFLPFDMSDSQINALYSACNVYVSPHHSEAWGLTIADAFLFKKPAIVTGYSGNLEFTNTSNSILLDYVEENIRDCDVFGLFTPEMVWAYPKESHLQEAITMVAENVCSPELTQKVENATATCSLFSREEILRSLLMRINNV